MMRLFATIICSTLLTISMPLKAQNIAPALWNFAYQAFSMNICYVSLNNEKEYGEAKQLTEKVLKKVGLPGLIKVIEFQKPGTNPEYTIEEIIESGTHCNGLVISGHHTGSFGGNRGGGSLNLRFLEDKSCQPDSVDWFTSVQSLWLQGCRTLGAPEELSQTGADLVDFHANRVYQVREEDGLDQNEFELMDDFANILDSDTPYANRFRKAFPRASVYGWTGTAPGPEAKSERSFPYHVYNMARILKENSGSFEAISNPYAAKMDLKSAQAYLSALFRLLLPLRDAKALDATVTSWIDHGNPNAAKRIFGLTNPDLNAHPPISANSKELVESRKLECSLRNTEDFNKTIEALDKILQSSAAIASTFYTLQDISRKRELSLSQKTEIQRRLKESPRLAAFLQRKLESPHLGFTRKIEVYGFYKELTGNANLDLEKAIKERTFEIIKKPAEINNYELIDLKKTVLRILAQSKLISGEELLHFIETASDVSVLKAVQDAILDEVDAFQNPKELLFAILESDKLNMDVLKTSISRQWSLSNANVGKEFFDKALSVYEEKGESSIYFLASLLVSLSECNVNIEGQEQVLEELLSLSREHPNSGRQYFDTLSSVLSAIADEALHFNNRRERFEETFKELKNLSQTRDDLLPALSSALFNALSKYPEDIAPFEGMVREAYAVIDQLKMWNLASAVHTLKKLSWNEQAEYAKKKCFPDKNCAISFVYTNFETVLDRVPDNLLSSNDYLLLMSHENHLVVQAILYRAFYLETSNNLKIHLVDAIVNRQNSGDPSIAISIGLLSQIEMPTDQKIRLYKELIAKSRAGTTTNLFKVHFWTVVPETLANPYETLSDFIHRNRYDEYTAGLTLAAIHRSLLSKTQKQTLEQKLWSIGIHGPSAGYLLLMPLLQLDKIISLETRFAWAERMFESASADRETKIHLKKAIEKTSELDDRQKTTLLNLLNRD